jgi:hypothetical protein
VGRFVCRCSEVLEINGGFGLAHVPQKLKKSVAGDDQSALVGNDDRAADPLVDDGLFVKAHLFGGMAVGISRVGLEVGDVGEAGVGAADGKCARRGACHYARGRACSP